MVNLANGQFGGKTYRRIWIGHVHAKYGVSWVENEPRSGVGRVLTKIGKIPTLAELKAGLMERGGQLSTLSLVSEIKMSGQYMDWGVSAKILGPRCERWPSAKVGADKIPSLYQRKVKGR